MREIEGFKKKRFSLYFIRMAFLDFFQFERTIIDRKRMYEVLYQGMCVLITLNI